MHVVELFKMLVLCVGIRIVLWSQRVWSAERGCCVSPHGQTHRKHNANLPEVSWGHHAVPEVLWPLSGSRVRSVYGFDSLR